jgi:hypothetical protein
MAKSSRQVTAKDSSGVSCAAGQKLEAKKKMVPITVIDRLNQKPIEARWV